MTSSTNKSISEQLDSLSNSLTKMKGNIQASNIRAAKLNIELSSIHDPFTAKQLEENKKICDTCYVKCESRSRQQKSSEDEKATNCEQETKSAEE